jgi:hypothetical protein
MGRAFYQDAQKVSILAHSVALRLAVFLIGAWSISPTVIKIGAGRFQPFSLPTSRFYARVDSEEQSGTIDESEPLSFGEN